MGGWAVGQDLSSKHQVEAKGAGMEPWLTLVTAIIFANLITIMGGISPRDFPP